MLQVCTLLFVWEGIHALTLAARAGLDMEDGYRCASLTQSNGAEYESEYSLIVSLMYAHFFAHLVKASKYDDCSPDMVLCFYDVLDTLERTKKPQARWLHYSTQTGYLMFSILVTIEIRRYLVEAHARIQETDG
jgi:hypothetical protein